MNKIKNMINQHSYTFWLLNLYLIILILLPKDWSTLFGVIPIRLCLSFLVFFVALIEGITKKISCNHFKIRSLLFVFFLFLLATLPSLFSSYHPIISLYTQIKFLSFIGIFFLFAKIKYTKEELRIFGKTILLSAFLVAIYALFCYIFKIDLNIIGVYQYQGALGRVSATFFNTIYFGIFINMVFIFVLYFFNKTSWKKEPWKLGLLGILGILLYLSLIFTYTRSAILIFCAILGFAIIFCHKVFLKWRTLFLIAILVLLMATLPGAKSLARVSVKDAYHMISNFDILSQFLPHFEDEEKPVNPNPNDPDFIDPSLEHRKQFSIIANRIAKDHLLTGVGFGTYMDYMTSSDFSARYPDYESSKTHPHSGFVLLFAETGIFGGGILTIFFILFVSKFLIMAFSLRKKNQIGYEFAVLGLAISLGFIGVSLIAENAFYDTQVFPLFLALTGLCIESIVLSLGDPEKKIKKTKVMYIASTGGHLNELMQLSPLFEKESFTLITEKTKSTLSYQKKYPKRVFYLLYGTKDKKIIIYLFKLLANCFISLYYFIKIRPTTIISTGTHTAGPMCCLGKIFGSKIIFIETFANATSKTSTGKLIYLFADVFIVQWESMLKLYPKAIYGGWIY